MGVLYLKSWLNAPPAGTGRQGGCLRPAQEREPGLPAAQGDLEAEGLALGYRGYDLRVWRKRPAVRFHDAHKNHAVARQIAVGCPEARPEQSKVEPAAAVQEEETGARQCGNHQAAHHRTAVCRPQGKAGRRLIFGLGEQAFHQAPCADVLALFDAPRQVK